MYKIGQQKRTNSFREMLVHSAGATARRVQAALKREAIAEDESTFWALQDVSFEVNHGEVVGIIGRNGAGKSTLLKLLTRITEPTTGRIEAYGRVASLLEVGTGFHPELTGRENIYMNGAILGMSRREIERKFDEIVAFAEVEKFLDTPVKRYSSGMYVRLAFAVAAHLETEILLIDEVLAVGDAQFQKKCLGKMGEVAKDGRTVLFVSHNMAAVRSMCNYGVYLDHGTVAFSGPIDEALSQYLLVLENRHNGELESLTERRGHGRTRVTQVDITCPRYLSSQSLMVGEAAEFTFHLSHPMPLLTCTFTIYNEMGLPIASFNSANQAPGDYQDDHAIDTFICTLETVCLLPGRYRINMAVDSTNALEDHVEGAAFFQVHAGLLAGRSVKGDDTYGVIAVPHRWGVRQAKV